MKGFNWKLRAVLFAVMAVIGAVGVSYGQARPAELVGQWVAWSERCGVNCKVDLELFPDGTGVMDGKVSITWKVMGKRLVLQNPLIGQAADYKVSGYELILTYDEHKIETYVRKEYLATYTKKKEEEERRKEEEEEREAARIEAERKNGAERAKKEAEQRHEKTSSYFTDSRDGRKYRTVKIGGKAWMAENLDYQTKYSWCYDDDESECKRYGRLYGGEAKTVCPSGWHLPTREDWDGLVAAVGGDKAGKKLKSAYGWLDNGNGSDDYGFTGLPGGYARRRDRGGSGFYSVGEDAKWWMDTKSSNGSDYLSLNGGDENGVLSGQVRWDEYAKYYVRCVEGPGVASSSLDTPNRNAPKSASPATMNNIDGASKSASPTTTNNASGVSNSAASGSSGGGDNGVALTGARSRASIQRVVMQNMRTLRLAYNKRLREKPGIAGKITVKFSIDEFGKVISAKIVESTIGDSEFEATVVSLVKSWDFEKIDKPGDVTEVTYPSFNFSP